MTDGPNPPPPSAETPRAAPAGGPAAPAPKTKPRSWLFRIVRILVLAYIGLCLLLVIFEDSFIYFPAKYPEGNWDPASIRAGSEDVWIPIAEGIRIHGWWVPGKVPARGTFLFSHGNAGNLTHRDEHLQELSKHGFNVLIYDYEGYGRSDGAPNEKTCTRDGIAAFDYLTSVRKIPAREIFIFGESIGGGISVEVALQRPEAAGLILQSAFTSLPEVAQVHYPFLPARWIARTKFNNFAKIGSVKMPVRIEHGTVDEIVPFSHGERLFAAAPEPKQFVPVEGAGHNDLIWVAGRSHFQGLREWADQMMDAAAARGPR